MDYVITRQRDQNDILDTRAMRGADCSTDHVILRSKIAFVLQKTSNKTKGKPRPKLNVEKLRNEETCKEFQKQMNNIMDYDDMVMNLEEKWNKLKHLPIIQQWRPLENQIENADGNYASSIPCFRKEI